MSTIQIIVSVVTIMISFAAMIVAALAYRLNRKLPNENKIFEEKIKAYNEVIKVNNDAVNEIIGCINEYSNHQDLKGLERKELMDELNDAIDDALNSAEDIITNSSLILPKQIYDQLVEFLDILDQQEYLNELNDKIKLTKWLETIDKAFDNFVETMRKEIEYDALNSGLISRTRSSRSSQAKKHKHHIS